MGYTSPYTPNTDSDRRAMLDAIGVDSVDDLFADIPAEHRNPDLDLPPPTSELELRREIEAMAGENLTPGSYSSFLGGGSYRHFVPAVVRQIAAALVVLGLIGTVAGFIIALSGVSAEEAGTLAAVQPMISTLISGMSVALYTTLEGAILGLWLTVNYRMLATGTSTLYSELLAANGRV